MASYQVDFDKMDIIEDYFRVSYERINFTTGTTTMTDDSFCLEPGEVLEFHLNTTI